MTQVAPNPNAGSTQTDVALLKFRNARANARRFHKQAIGDVDPNHCFADFLGKVQRNDTAGIRKEYGVSLDYCFGNYLDASGCRSKAALSGSAGGVSGGYLVPLELSVDLMVDVGEQALIRPLAQVQPMTSATLDLPYFDCTTTTGTAGVPTFFGGMQMSFASEGAARPESEPKFRNVELHVNDLCGIVLASNTFIADSFALESWLKHLFARSIAWYEDYFFLNGTGAGQPLGILNAAATIRVSRGTGNKILLADIAAMDAKSLPSSLPRQLWLASVSSLAQLGQLLDAAGNATWTPNFQPLIQTDRTKFAIGVLNNRPLFVTEKLPALGTYGDLVLFDPSLYVVGDRGALEIAFSSQYPTAFGNGQSAWRITDRVDGQPLLSKTVTLQDQATVCSPYAALN